MGKHKIYLILDNLRSAHNVGSVFRTADAFGVEKIFLCGTTPRPDGSVGEKIAKTALGAEKNIGWEYVKQTWRCVEQLKKQGIHVVALEQDKKSNPIKKCKPQFPLAVVLGNEVGGVSRGVLDRAEQIIEIPMLGKKESLNVSVATGVILYAITELF